MNKDDIFLENGQMSAFNFAQCLSVINCYDFDNMFFETAKILAVSNMLVEQLETMKSKYDVCNIIDKQTGQDRTSDFFKLLRSLYLLKFSSGITLSLLTPIGLKKMNFEHIRRVIDIAETPHIVQAPNGGLCVIKTVSPVYSGLDYKDNILTFMQFLKEEFYGNIPFKSLNIQDVYARVKEERQKSFKKHTEDSNDLPNYTQDPNDLNPSTDLIFYYHYLSRIKDFREHYEAFEEIVDPEDFMMFTMTYELRGDEEPISYPRPIDTSYRQPIPEKDALKLKEYCKNINELMAEAKARQDLAEQEFKNYENLIIKKYPAFGKIIRNNNHR